jgi:hypothetical protein
MYDGESIKFGGKNGYSSIPSRLLNSLTSIFWPLLEKFKKIFDSPVCFYGEGYGLGIQKAGKKYDRNQTFVLFDVKIGEWWLNRKDVEDISTKLGIHVVPIVGMGTLDEMVSMVFSGFYSQWGRFMAEGIVARPEVELKTRSDDRIITKIKYKDFDRRLDNKNG